MLTIFSYSAHTHTNSNSGNNSFYSKARQSRRMSFNSPECLDFSFSLPFRFAGLPIFLRPKLWSIPCQFVFRLLRPENKEIQLINLLINSFDSASVNYCRQLLTISPQSATFSPRIMNIPRSMSPYLLPTWIRSIVRCNTKLAAIPKEGENKKSLLVVNSTLWTQTHFTELIDATQISNQSFAVS